MSLVFSKSRQPQIIMTVFCQGLQSLACLLVSFLYDCSGYHQEFVSVNLRLRLVYSPFFHFCTSLDFLSRQIFGQFSPLHFLTIFCWKGQNSSANKNPSIFFWPKKKKMSFTSAKDACFRPSIVILVAKPLSCSCHSKVTAAAHRKEAFIRTRGR